MMLATWGGNPYSWGIQPAEEVFASCPWVDRQFPVAPHWVFYLPSASWVRGRGVCCSEWGWGGSCRSAKGCSRGYSLAGSAPFLQAPGSSQMCLWSFGPTCTGREELVAVSWADFLPVEAMCRSLAEPKDEEKKCVPPLHAIKARHSIAGSTSSFQVTTFSRDVATGPQGQHHMNAPLGTQVLLFDATSFWGPCKM